MICSLGGKKPARLGRHNNYRLLPSAVAGGYLAAAGVLQATGLPGK